MSKSTVSFEWQQLRDDQELPELPLGPPPDAAISTQLSASNPGQKRQRLVLIGGALCLLALALFSATWVERKAQAGLAEIESELVWAVDAEIWQAGNGQAREVAATAATPLPVSNLRNFAGIEVSHEKILSVEVQALRPDIAAVLVVTEARPDDYTAEDDALLAYRQLRFYRRTENGWQRTEPVPALWGQPQRLATEHFDITYRSRDAQAVYAVATELDALYAQMRANLGLSSAPAQKLRVEVVVDNISDRQRRWSASEGGPFSVSSPALLRAPKSLTDAAILRQSILLRLVDIGLEEAVSAHQVPPRWVPLPSKMRLWLLWELGGPLAEWRAPVLQWVYGNLQATDNDSAAPLPSGYSEMCALYAVWELAPVHTGLPLFCRRLDHQGAWRLIIVPNHHDIFTHLGVFTYFDEEFDANGGQGTPRSRLSSISTASLLEYITVTYGREQISGLWSVLHEHKNWETIIPAVFGVSQAEFEAGWLAYLAGQYP